MALYFNDGDVINLPNIEVSNFSVSSFDNSNFFNFGLSISYDILEEYKRDVVLTQYGDNQGNVLENMIYKLQYRNQDNNWEDLSKFNFLKSDSKGLISINGLEVGEYRLVSKIAPAGYDLPESIVFSIKDETDSTALLLTSFAKSNHSQQLIYIDMSRKNDVICNIYKYSFIVLLSLVSLLLIIFTIKRLANRK